MTITHAAAVAAFDPDQVRRWLTGIHGNHGGDGWVSISWIDGPAFRSRHFQATPEGLDAAAEFVTYINDTGTPGIYARMTAAREKPEKRGGADLTLTLPALWADLDIAGPGHKHDPAKTRSGLPLPADEDQAAAIITEAGLPEPSMWIHSGGGLYAIWFLDQPHVIDGDLDRIAKLSQDWQHVIGAAAQRIGVHYGTGVSDLARVLRIPGTLNRKTDDPRPCRILGREDGPIFTGGPGYNLAQLRAGLITAQARLEAAKPAKLAGATVISINAAGAKRDRHQTIVEPGQDYNDKATARQVVDDLMTPYGWTEDREDADYVYLTRPGKDSGVSATVSKKTAGVWVFTDASELPQNEGSDKGHRPFHLYAIRHHKGDHKAAAAALGEAGYGTPLADRDALKHAQANLEPIDWSDVDNDRPAAKVTPIVPVPVPIDSSSAPAPFPVDVLPPVMRRMVQAVAGNKQVPSELPAMIGLSAIATLAAPHLTICRSGDWVEPLNVYTLTVMDSGTGKTPAEKDVTRALRKIEQKIRNEHDAQYDDEIGKLQTNTHGAASDAKGNVEHKIADLETEKKRSRPYLLIGSDTTVEALTSVMARQGGAASIIDSEGEFFGIMSGRYSSGVPNIGIVLKAYDADQYRSHRVGREQDDIDRAVLTLGLCAQPVVISDAVKTPAMVERGLLARFLFAWPPNLLGTRDDEGDDYDQDAMDAWEAVLEGIHQFTLYCGIQGYAGLRLSRGALRLHKEFCAYIERRLHPDDGDLGNMPGWAAKHKARALRIAGLLHLAEQVGAATHGHVMGFGDRVDLEVGEESMRAAIEVCRWAIGHAQRVFGAASVIEVEDQRCLDVLAWVKKTQPAEFGSRDVARGCRKKWLVEGGRAELVPVLDRLVDDGYLAAINKTTRNNQTVIVYRPNPLLFADDKSA